MGQDREWTGVRVVRSMTARCGVERGYKAGDAQGRFTGWVPAG